MRLYHHYKNKPYRYIGVARHSETLDEVVIYETLYKNKLGKVWVRPKDMFFQSVNVDGQSVPRFKQIPLSLKETNNINSTDLETVILIAKKLFENFDESKFHAKLKNFKKIYLVTAFVDARPAGFKLGYEQSKDLFYSWLGGVVPEFRRLGIASNLMRTQHDWCGNQGYKAIKTKARNRFHEMLVLNLRHGFDIIDCRHEQNGIKILMEKNL